MINLVQTLLNHTTNHKGGAWILLLILVLLAPLPSLAPSLSTPITNQLETSILSSTSQLTNSQGNQWQEAAVIQPARSVGNQTRMGMEGVEPNITSTNGAFDGYNLFILYQITNTDPPKRNYSLLITNMEGDIIRVNEDIPFISWKLPQDRHTKFINSTTLLYGADEGAVLWNIYDNTSVALGFIGHHEYEYNPINNTFFAFQAYNVIIDEMEYRFDEIREYNTTGNVVWSLDTRSFISHTQWCPYRDMEKAAADITHSNSLFFDAEEDVFYYHARNVNTFYKIDHKTGQVLWGLGEYGDFTLFDRHGNQQKTLFYHAHAIEKVDENTFILFDNDYHNQTKPANPRSRILEITINETTLTAHESWSWTAPPNYYSSSFGDADRLPNGNRLGTFGTHKHPPDIGAILVEVNEEGQIVWEMNFPNTEDCILGVYNMERFRFNPIINPHTDIRAITTEDVTVRWQTWYNFRTNRRMKGIYTLYLNGTPIENGTHVFDKFWRPTNLTINLGKLEVGNYNLTLALTDEAGHLTTDRLNISVSEFYIEREGPLTFELGQENALIQWKGGTIRPLLAYIFRNNTQLASFVWNGSVITLDPNTVEAGTYLVSLQLFDKIELIHEDRFLVTIFPAVAPVIHSFPTDQSLTWYDSLVLSWELFDHVPASWSIFVNETLTASGTWEIPSYPLHWSVPILDEGRYNVTLTAYDRVGHQTSRTMWLTVVSPSPPVIATCPYLTEMQWGQENASLSWEVHGGTHWTLWKNWTATYSGEVTSNQIFIRIENWEQEDWRSGIYNLTLQVAENGGTAAATCTSWLNVLVNFGDAFADSIITEASMWYSDGDHALGPPDGNYTHLYFDYGNGHVTLDMGPGEEVFDGKGVDFTVYAREGEYAVFVGNNLSAPVLVGNQETPPIIFLGTGIGNTSFDLASIGLEQARYIQIVYFAGEKVELDAVVAIHVNHPPRPPNPALWKFFVSGSLIALVVMGVLWVRRRKTVLSRINKIYHVLFCGLITIFFLSRAFHWRPPPPLPTHRFDIWHIYQWTKALNSGTNSYTVWGSGEATMKSISCLPLYIVIGQIPMILGFSTYNEWTNVMRLLHVIAELGIGLLLYKLALERRRPALGLYGAAIWFFNTITIFVWQIQQIDAITICFVFWALYYAERRPNYAGFLLGCSIGFKLITLLLVPLFVLLRIRDERVDQRTVRDQITAVLHSLLFIALVPLVISLPFLLWDYQSFFKGIVAPGILKTAAHTSTQYVGTFHEILIREMPIIHQNLSKLFSEQTINLIFLRAPLILALLGFYIVYWRMGVDKYLTTSFIFAIYLYFSPVVFTQYLIWPIVMILAAIISRGYVALNNPHGPNPNRQTPKQRFELVDRFWTLLFVLFLPFAGFLRYYYLKVVIEQPFSLQAFACMASDLGIGAIIYQVAREKNRPLLGVFGAAFWLFNQATLHIFGLQSNISIGLFFAVLALYLLKAQPDLAKLILGISIVYSPPMSIFAIIFLIGPRSRNMLFETAQKRTGNYLQLKQVLQSVFLLCIIPVGLFPIVKTDYKAFLSNFLTRTPYNFLGVNLPFTIKSLFLMWVGLLVVCYLHRNELDRFTYATLAAVLFYTFTAHFNVYIPFFWFLFVILYMLGGHFTLNSYLPDSEKEIKALSSESEGSQHQGPKSWRSPR